MMNKYEEALNDIRYTAHHLNNHIYNCDEICDEYCDDLLTDCDILQELVDQQKTSTLEEVKKEWEEFGRGHTFLEDETFIKIYYYSSNIYTFDKKKKEIDIYPVVITFYELNLLNKTLKALGWEEEK